MLKNHPKVTTMRLKWCLLLLCLCGCASHGAADHLGKKFMKRMIMKDFDGLGIGENSASGDADCGGSGLANKENCAENSKGKDRSCNINLGSSSKRKATNIAQKAAQEAKAASDAQVSAAESAARQVKTQLAEKAGAAAKAAEAALAGKQQIVDQLESEVREAELVVQEQGSSLQNTQCNCNAAAKAAKQSGIQLKTLTEAAKNAQENVQNSEQAASGAQQELSEKQQLVEAAKNRVEQLLRQLDSARTDFKKTKQAAENAACAAQEAKQRAVRERRMAEVREKLLRRRRHNQYQQ
ncbi:uncharacterized protein LOC115620430 [Scaptodrosophila lebanonensis]|uniref:Uncharacterized protein LOC115620430 n=1 Tax=Drosophila lebanonensis TaxID=7225 RepID=A0A6J2T2M9_DROLE|nr:uncharacterized protein LOC115620430 [Scaptodrosophila lebanonensis]